jgi:RNase P subunit RPR2
VSYAADETYDVYNERFPRARKEHQCDACLETIVGGQRYARIGIVYDGRAGTIVRCMRCQKIHEHLRTVLDSEEWADERLNCGHTYQQRHECDPPEDIAALAFALPGEIGQ